MSTQPKNQPVDELTYGIDMGAPNGDKTALSIQKNGKIYSFVGEEADVLVELLQAECNRARLAESKGYCDDGHYHDYENDRAMLPSERTAELQQLKKEGKS